MTGHIHKIITFNNKRRPSCFFFVHVCTAQLALVTAAPVLDDSIHFGVFAMNENVSLLLSPISFLPTCTHITHGAPVSLNLTLLNVNNGFIWVQKAGVPPNPTGRLVPLSPLLLQPHLTGQYRCTSPGGKVSAQQYRLGVVGKKESIFLVCKQWQSTLRWEVGVA